MPDALERYTMAALTGARSRAADIAASMVGVDPSPIRVIDELLAPSQREVGARWQQLMCTVGEEHAATFVTESVMASISVGFEPEPDQGTIVMVCAEGEWHALPARMATELLIHHGWRVIYLGPATPAVQLRTYLAGIDADAVGVSATMTSNLPGAARSVAVARRLGMRVVAGGAAFGADRRRALAIGADGWTPSVRHGLDLEAVLWDDDVELDPHGEWATLEERRVDLVHAAIAHLDDRASMPSTSESWTRQVVSHVDDMVGVAIAAVLCRDRTIVDEHRAWLETLAMSEALPPELARYGFEAVQRAVTRESAVAAELLAGAA
jgi:methanogenic corrinoid protein MtbC1